MAATDILVGRVAEILNARELVITLGSERGVKPGMKFAVLTDPLEIRDPATGEVLDTLEREKARVRAKVVRGRITICRTYPRERVPEPSEVDATYAKNPYVIIDEGYISIQGDAPKAASPYAEDYVKIGDRVRLVEEPD